MGDSAHCWPWDYCARCEAKKPTDGQGTPLVDGALIAEAGWAIWGEWGCVCPTCQAGVVSEVALTEVA